MTGRGARTIALCAVALTAAAASPWFGASDVDPSSSSGLRILLELRLPRLLLAWCAGATFGLCGLICQAIFRNPLADPSILGISSGASLGAALSIRAAGTVGVIASVSTAGCAFLGATAASVMIALFARLSRSDDSSLPLAGVAISALLSSAAMIVLYTSSPSESFRALAWTMGRIQPVGAAEGTACIPPLIASIAAARCFYRELDLMTFGDELAASRGASPSRVRRAMLAAVALSVALVVSRCGPLAFVGLIAPHIARTVAGPSHRSLAPASAVVGGTLVTIADAFARTIWAPAEMPIGIVLSFAGAPFFLWLLFKKPDKRSR